MRFAVNRERLTAMLGVALLSLSLVACDGGGGATSSTSPPARRAQSSPQPAPELPEITSVRQVGGQAIRASSSSDWVLVDFGHVG